MLGEGQKQRRRQGVKAHSEAGRSAGLLTHLEGPGGTDAMGGNPDGEAPHAVVGYASGIKDALGHHRPQHPGADDQHRGQGRQPPSFSAMPMATGMVTDLGARETSV